MRRLRIVAVVAGVAGCAEQGVGVEGTAPEIVAAEVIANPENVLAAGIVARVRQADSAVVRFGLAGGPLDSVTPAVPVAGPDSVLLPVLGLLPERRYRLQVVAHGGGGSVEGDLLAFTTGALPADLPRFAASGSDPTPGFVIFATGRFAVAIDNSGRVVWYREFPGGAGLNFMAVPTGRFVARPVTSDPGDREPWIELDPWGRVVRGFGCARGLVSRPHDLIGEPDGGYWILCDETVTMDLARLGGRSDARVTGTVVQHVDGAGALRFEWSAFDHFELTDLDPLTLAGASVNWTHGNALARDGSGNLMVSFRNLSEVTAIDSRSGVVLWRMGGARNQFRFSEPGPAFSRQHGLRLAGGDVMLLDNLGEATGSRAERYRIDAGAMTATLVGAYAPSVPVFAQLGGTTQVLGRGRTLVSFGTAGRVEEYDGQGRRVWQIDGNPGYLLRAERIGSLYRPTAVPAVD